MATSIIWGRNSGADIKLPFAGNAALVGTRIINAGAPDDDVALSYNEFMPDESTILLYHLNGSGPDVVDSGPYGNDGTLVGTGISRTSDAWLGDGAVCCTDPSGASYVHTPHDASMVGLSELTLETWVRSDDWHYQVTEYRNVQMFQKDNAYRLYGANWGNDIHVWVWIDRVRYTFTWGRTLDRPTTWRHVAVVITPPQAHCYVDGQYIGAKDIGSGTIAFDTKPLKCMLYGELCCDEMRISSVARYSSDFSLHRFESGTVTLQYTLPSQYRLTAIDWDGLLGSAYGLITQIAVNTVDQGWQVVAQDANGLTPPLINLNRIVRGPDLVRVTLAPKQDTLQSETPVLDWLRIVIEPLNIGVGRIQTPVILTATNTSIRSAQTTNVQQVPIITKSGRAQS